MTDESIDDQPPGPGAARFRIFATLRIYHDEIDLDAITDQFGLRPDRPLRKGEPFLPGGNIVAETGRWSFTSNGTIVSDELSEHIAWIMGKLEGKDDMIRRLQSAGHQVEVACYWLDTEGGDGVIRVPSAVMKRLGDLGIGIWIDIIH